MMKPSTTRVVQVSFLVIGKTFKYEEFFFAFKIFEVRVKTFIWGKILT